MPFKREWDSTCPKVWDKWEIDDATWIIQDMPPEDDNLATELMVEQFLEDENLCQCFGVSKHQPSVEASREFWRQSLSNRTSLACYKELDGRKELVALNACPVKQLDDINDDEVFPAPLQQVVDCMGFLDKKGDPFGALGVDSYLGGAGLWVRRDTRGAGLGCRVLKAREPLCRFLGLKATVTLFSGPASQKSAAKAGFYDVTTATYAELADAGFKLPRDETIVIKLMAKKYV